MKKTKRCYEGLQGASFGIMEGIIMMLGVIMGLSATGSKFILLIGALTAGIADSFANASAFHVSEETEHFHTRREILKSTFYCFFATLAMVITLSLPILFFSIRTAVIISWIIGVAGLAFVGYGVSRINKKYRASELIREYVLMGVIASIICYGIGRLASMLAPLV